MALNGRTAIRIGVVLVALGVFGWQRFHRPRAVAPADAGASAAPAATAGAPMPAAKPRTWRLGALTLESCELGRPGGGATAQAWCTTFEVPENRADPHGRKIGLKLAVVRSDAAQADQDIVVLLAGGPGEAATASWQPVAPAFADLLKHHHVLLLDQRGTGGSNPLSCKADVDAPDDNAGDADAALDPGKIRQQVAACLVEVEKKADPRYYTTTVAAEDLEDVRRALGAPPFDLVGVSYGTRMAQQYLMRHPDGVRSMVLDSPVPNQQVLGQDFAVNLDQALRKDFAACTATPSCRQRFGDPMQTLYALRDALRANPHKVTFRDPQSYATVERTLGEYSLASVVRMFAYAPETAALLPLSIDAAAHGDVGPLLGQAKLLSTDLSGDMNNGMQMSVTCSEDADLLQERPQDENTILGNRLVRAIKAECSVWPHGTRPADFHAPLQSDVPTLILSGELDPVTPPSYGAQILAGLGDARQLVLAGQGHGVMARGCMPRLLGEFVDKRDPKRLDASCLNRLGPIPAFIDFNGAAP